MHLISNPEQAVDKLPKRTTDVWVPVKIPTGEKSLHTFVKNWKEGAMKGMPFNGEIEPPNSDTNPTRQIEIDPDRRSHCVLDVDERTWDPQKSTVMIHIRPAGPYGAFLQDNLMKNKIRFLARTVTVRHNETGEREKRIVTFDSVVAPGVKIDR